MSFSGAPGTLGSNQSKASGTTVAITTGATAEVGNVIVVVTAWDNTDTADGDTTRLSCADSTGSNVYTKVREHTNTDAGVAEDGVTVAIFHCLVTSQLNSGGTITVSSSTARTAKAVTAWEFTKDTGTTVAVEATQVTLGASGSPLATVSLAGMTSREYLLVWGLGKENLNTVTITADADYSALTKIGTTGGGTETNMLVGGGYRVATLTGDTVGASTSNSVGNSVQILAALYQLSAGPEEHFGAASVEATFGATVAGRKDAHAATTVPVLVSITTAGTVTEAAGQVFGAAALPVTFGTTTTARAGGYGTATRPVLVTISVRGGTPSPVPNLAPVPTGQIAAATVGRQPGRTSGRIRTPDTGEIA